MTCISPPELSDEQLLRYLDDEASEEIRTHIERCNHCRERALELGQLNEKLTGLFYRLACPSPQELGEYRLGLLTRDRANWIARHLLECTHCRQELEQTGAFLDAVASDLDLRPVKEPRGRVANLLELGPGTLQPALVGLRGEGEDSLIFQAGNVVVAINSQPQMPASHLRVVSGLVMEAEFRGASAVLWQADRLIDSAPVDDAGNFSFQDIPAGTYELGLHVHSDEIEDIRIEKLTL